MVKNHWLSWTRKALSSPKADMEDWRYSDERMLLRAEVFRALQHHLADHTRAVYEFCTLWVDLGNPSNKSIEEAFQDYLRKLAEDSYAKTN